MLYLIAVAIALAFAAAPQPASAYWKRVASSPSTTQPYFVCPQRSNRPRCALIADPTRGSRRRGPVPAGAVTAGPVQEASPALSGTGVEGGFAPADLRTAYALPSASAGSGQTVAIVDAYDDPNAESDLSVYRSKYELPACTAANGCFRKVGQTGTSTYPPAEKVWAREISLDLDMVSAICPNCHVLLVEAKTSEAADLAAAENEAATLGATEISDSFAEPTRPPSLAAYDHPGIPIAAAAGDSKYGVEWPAASPHVIAVGGTSLTPPVGRGGWIETVWSGTGSGCSKEPKPSWQTDSGCPGRTNNDVAAVADPNTPVSAYDTYETGSSPWLLLGGTSVSAPIVASAMALASPYTRSFDGAQGLYLQAANGYAGFDDVLTGSNGFCGNYLCEARLGYDGPSGLGTPRGAPEVPPPTPLTGTAGSITVTGATLRATVNSHGGRVDECSFQYGPTTSYGSSAPCSSLPTSATVPVSVSAPAAGLDPGSTYHFRLVVGYSGSSAAGGDATFATLPSPPAVAPGSPSALTSSAVTLNAQVNPNGGLVSECRFQYGPTASYGASAPCTTSPGEGRAPVSVSASIGGLAANTIYHFRIAAGNPAGNGYGSDQTVTTLPDAPTVLSGPASAITRTSATLNATVNPNGVPLTSCEFEFASLEHYVPCANLPEPGHSPVALSAPVASLKPGTSFRYRVIASNAGGTSYGAIQQLTTLPATSSAYAARLISPTLQVNARGTLTARVSCPAGHGRCLGTITLQSMNAIRTKRILTLAKGSFNVAGGRVANVTLQVSTAARALLARAPTLRARATVLTRGVPSPPAPWRAAVTLVRR